jgi:hypothetical protein
MNTILVSAAVFGCVFGGALCGMALRTVLPEHHRSQESRDVVKLAMGLIATMSALLLGMLVAAAKESYDTQKDDLTQMTARVAFLDRVLAQYGPEAKGAREMLRGVVARALDEIWPKDSAGSSSLAPTAAEGGTIYDQIQELSPQDDAHRTLKAQASSLALEMGQLRRLMFERRASAISTVLLIVVVFWLTMIFFSFGLFAPANGTVTAALSVAALSVSCAIFLILEMDRPFEGIMRISSAPMRAVLAHLGQ